MNIRKRIMRFVDRWRQGVWTRRPLRQLWFALRYRLGRRRAFRPLFIIAEQRTGSTLLGHYLDSLPGAALAGEVLGFTRLEGMPRRIHSREAALRHLTHTFNALGGDPCVAKLMCGDLADRNVALEDVRDLFPEARYILLYRQSLGEQYVSHMKAKKTQVWHVTSAKAEAPRIRLRLKRNQIERYFRKRRAAMEELLARPWLKEKAILLSYEEIAADPQKIFNEVVCPFLGAAPSAVSAPLRKMNKRPLSESVENYDEVADLLTGPSSWHRYSW